MGEEWSIGGDRDDLILSPTLAWAARHKASGLSASEIADGEFIIIAGGRAFFGGRGQTSPPEKTPVVAWLSGGTQAAQDWTVNLLHEFETICITDF